MNSCAMSYFESADKMMHVTDNGMQISLCHFSLAEWNGYYKGHTHIYGHINNKKEAVCEFMQMRKKSVYAGCMLHGYAPVRLNELRKKRREVLFLQCCNKIGNRYRMLRSEA